MCAAAGLLPTRSDTAHSSDPLLDLMTSRETLAMYARIHGLGESSISDIVQKMLNTLGLSRFADKQCGIV